MTEIIPFRGIYYNRDKVSGDAVTASPYDVITPEMQEAYYGRSPYNVVRVDFGKELPGDDDSNNKYSRAAAHLADWLTGGIMVRSERPAYYAYRIDYRVRGERKSLTGFFGLVKLVELGEGVYPHEATHSKPKQDRLSLMESTKANTSPIFSLYRLPGPGVTDILSREASGEPYLTATDTDGTMHSLWVLNSPQGVESMRERLKDAAVYIADGHHRYETALAYQKTEGGKDRDSGRANPWDYVMMFLADVESPGLTVLPTHRVVTVDVEDIFGRLSGYFAAERLPRDADIVKAIEGRNHVFGLYAGGEAHVLTYKGGDLEDVHPALRELDVVVLHKMVFGKLLEVGNWAYEMDYARTIAKVDNGEYDAAFFLNPTAVKDVERVALSGMRMPPKSTFFYPKIQTGFVMNSLTSF